MAESKHVASVETAGRPVMKHFEQFLTENFDHCKKMWDRAEANQKFASGGKNQWNDADFKARTESGRPTITIDDTQLAVRAVSGRQATARFAPMIRGRNEDDEARAGVLSEIVRFMRQAAGADKVEQSAFRSLLIDNLSVVEMHQDYGGRDPYGRTLMENPRIWECIWDGRAKDPNLADRTADARGYTITVDEFLMRFPKEKEKIAEWTARSMRDTAGGALNVFPWQHHRDGRFLHHKKNLIFQINYQWRERGPAWTFMVPPGMGQHPFGPEAWARAYQSVLAPMGVPQVVDEEVWRQLLPGLQQMAAQGQLDPKILASGRPRMIVMDEDAWGSFQEEYAQATGAPPGAFGPEEGNYLWRLSEATIVGDQVLKVSRLPYRGFTRIYMTGIPCFEREKMTPSSVVEAMKEPQVFKNYVTTVLTAHLVASRKQGMIIRSGAIENEAEIETRLSKPWWILKAKPGISPAEAVEVIEGGGFPQGASEFLELAQRATWAPLGLNPNTLGQLQDPRRVSGVVFDSLAGAPDMSLSWEFDAYRGLIRLGAELLLDFAAAYGDRDTLADVVGQQKAALLPEREEWKESLRYDAVVDEVAASKTERMQAWEYLSRQGTVEQGISAGWLPPWLLPMMMPQEMLPSGVKAQLLGWMDSRGIGPNSAVPPPEEQPPDAQGGELPPEE